MFVSPTGESSTGKAKTVDFLGLNVNRSAAIAGQWILLALGVLLLVATVLTAYMYRKARMPEKSLSTMELKQKD